MKLIACAHCDYEIEVASRPNDFAVRFSALV